MIQLAKRIPQAVPLGHATPPICTYALTNLSVVHGKDRPRAAWKDRSMQMQNEMGQSHVETSLNLTGYKEERMLPNGTKDRSSV